MAVRFQVEPDFYDHPKTIGLSDAAVALWVRAGSYSAAKLLDGYVPERVLALLSRCPEAAAEELVSSGLWRRAKGGFRFHEWDQRNLTRARVEQHREEWRERKRRQRQQAAKEEKQQVEATNVPAGHARDSNEKPAENPPAVMSTSVLVSVSKKSSSAAPKDDDPDWQAFWSVYPRKVGKGQARKAWARAIKAADPATIIAGAKLYAERRRGQDPTYTAHPATWLNGERWNDEELSHQANSAAWWMN